jgi:2-polyprenyl-3-methyl-5-hydroxy-6-metoxy-1,4-benzoquinol methylase
MISPSPSRTATYIPDYELFRSACQSGLSVVRPLTQGARTGDVFGWNFGTGWPPSYEAFGRMRVLATLRQALALRPNRVLEVAAGDGALCACLAATGATVFANDLRGEALAKGVEGFENRDNIKLLPGNCFDLHPAQVGCFDLVIACEVIEHVAHTVDFMRHLKSFLSPGGHILLTTPNGSYFRNSLPTYAQIEDATSLEAEQFKPDADGHLFLITPAELRDISAEVGLHVEQLELCASPFITGHCKLSFLRGRPIARACYSLERFCHRLPSRLGEKLFFSMSAVLG